MYDYTDGKLDWMAAGLPTESVGRRIPRAGDVARRDVPTCRAQEPLDEVRERLSSAGWDACVVVNSERVVFGILRAEELGRTGDNSVEAVMRRAPSTFRPHVPIGEMAHYMTHHGLASSPITTSDGKLLGLLLVDDASRAAHEAHEAHVHDDDGDDGQ